MMTVRITLWIARVAGTLALLLGLLYWITGIEIVTFHMLCGIIFALSFLIFSITIVFTASLRLWGVVGIIYALILPVFGLTQSELLKGDLHWLIRLAHLLVGLGALTLIQVIYTRYRQHKVGTATTSGSYPQSA